MPAKRLPWFKLWVGATRHEKVATLPDSAFRTWVELLDAASQQTPRGRFLSIHAAAAVVRRPARTVASLVRAGLLDERQDGVWMHDWTDWQRWRPEDDANGTESPPHPPPINTRTTHEQHRNVNGTPPEELANVEAPRASNAKTEKRDGDGDVDGEERRETETLSLSARASRARRKTQVDDAFREQMSTEFEPRLGSREAVLITIDDALGHSAARKRSDLQAYVRNWLRKDADAVQSRHPRVLEPPPIEESSVREECPECQELVTSSGFGHKREPDESLPSGVRHCSRYWQPPSRWRSPEVA